ncbi:alpha/beta fold hydrolase [Mesorhizobium sp. KR9-304]|uniref:alpha/beta fold hydrolase n=1 Tax=Mesorhizobium sp. KR9-304 TaxID=3156614 RepID=UPI0032B53108
MASVIGWIVGAVFLAVIFVAGYFALATRRIAARAERLVPPSGKFIDLDGNRIHYVEIGEGRPIVFVHGLGGQLHHFRHPMFPLLPGYRLIALDRPGSGYSVRGAGATARLPEQAETVASLIRALELERPLVVGHSLGGTVTLTLALNHPELVSGIVTLAPLTHMMEEVPPEFKGLYIASPLKRWLIARTTAVPASLKYAKQTLDFVFGPQKWPEDYIVAGGGMLGLRPSHFYATSSDIVAIGKDLGEIEGRYGEIKMPAAMMFGTADRVLDHRRHGLPMRDKVASLDFELVDGHGHMLQFMASDRVAKIIERTAAKAFG